jgi:hypothetical protein
MSKRKKHNPIQFTIDINLFDAGIDFCITPDRVEAINKINKERGSDILVDENCLGQCIRSEEYNPLILIDRIPLTSDEWGVVQHEIFHAVVGIMFYVGVILDISTEEVWSNTIGYVSKEFCEIIAKYKRRKKSGKK